MFYINFDGDFINCIISSRYDPDRVINAYATAADARVFMEQWAHHRRTVDELREVVRFCGLAADLGPVDRLYRGISADDLLRLRTRAFDAAVRKIRRAPNRAALFRDIGKPGALRGMFGVGKTKPDFYKWKTWRGNNALPVPKKPRAPKDRRVRTMDGTRSWASVANAADDLNVVRHAVYQHLSGSPLYPSIRGLKLEYFRR